EELADGQRFIGLCREITGEIAQPKPILAVKSGRTPAGARAVSSHTGSLAGGDEVYDAVFLQSGVLRVDSVEELFHYAVAFANQPLPSGRRVAIVTNAGGPGLMAAGRAVGQRPETGPGVLHGPRGCVGRGTRAGRGPHPSVRLPRGRCARICGDDALRGVGAPAPDRGATVLCRSRGGGGRGAAGSAGSLRA